MQNLTITIIQAELVWEDIQKNLINFDEKLKNLDEKTDLIILPEMFNTGFSINPKPIAEPPEGKTFRWMQEKSKQHDAAVCGSIITEDKGKYYNRFYWVLPDGSCEHYDKKHLFRLGKEWEVFSPGKKRVIIEYMGWKILPLVCYDLRFPVWSKNRLLDQEFEYDLLLYVANWPVVRKYAWKHLLIARALENIAYVAGVNRVGVDGNNMNHSGDSMLIDTKGQIIAQAKAYHETLITIYISKTELEDFRRKFRFALDWDEFQVEGI